MVEQMMRELRVLEEKVKARLEVDLDGLVAGVRARLSSSLELTSLPIDATLANRQGPFGWGRVTSWAWEARNYRKIVLSQVAMRPLIEGFALVLLPRPRLAAPVFACDLMALPTRVSVHADLYATEPLSGAARAALLPLRESFGRLETRSGPAFAAHLGSGVGLHAKVSLRLVDGAFAAVTAALAAALELTAKAPEGAAGAASQQQFFETFHAHGPRRGALGRIFGKPWAERYSRLIFE